MTDSKLSMLFFEGGLVLALVSMVLGPFGVEDWAISSAAVACFMALAGTYIAFGSWNEAPKRTKHNGAAEKITNKEDEAQK